MQLGAVRPCVEQAAVIAVTREALADVREPEAAAAIEHDVVRAAEPFAVERLVDALVTTRAQVDALDAPRGVVSGCPLRHAQSVHIPPLQPAVVANVDGTVRSDRRAV